MKKNSGENEKRSMSPTRRMPIWVRWLVVGALAALVIGASQSETTVQRERVHSGRQVSGESADERNLEQPHSNGDVNQGPLSALLRQTTRVIASVPRAFNEVRHDPMLLILVSMVGLMLYKILAHGDSPVKLLHCALMILARLIRDVISFANFVRILILRELAQDGRGCDDTLEESDPFQGEKKAPPNPKPQQRRARIRHRVRV